MACYRTTIRPYSHNSAWGQAAFNRLMACYRAAGIQAFRQVNPPA